jgi:chemotaxis signal transduction protein
MSLETGSLVPSFVIFQVGTRRVALPRDCVAEMIASPLLFSFPHTTTVITGVALRRGRIVPVLDLGPGLLGAASPAARFFLVVERRISNISERCAIPIQGECELVAANMLPSEGRDEFVTGCLEHNGVEIEVLDLEKSIAAGANNQKESMVAAEALS